METQSYILWVYILFKQGKDLVLNFDKNFNALLVLSCQYFHNETEAFEYVERIIWADMKACPHCGGLDRLTIVKANPAKRIRVGLWRCGECKKQVTARSSRCSSILEQLSNSLGFCVKNRKDLSDSHRVPDLAQTR